MLYGFDVKTKYFKQKYIQSISLDSYHMKRTVYKMLSLSITCVIMYCLIEKEHYKKMKRNNVL
jgi:hypothetical protein